MAARRRKRNQVPPKVDWWECEDCETVFATRVDPERPASSDDLEDCRFCESKEAVLLVGGCPIVP